MTQPYPLPDALYNRVATMLPYSLPPDTRSPMSSAISMRGVKHLGGYGIRREIRIKFNSSVKQAEGFLIPHPGPFVKICKSALKQVVSIEIDGAAFLDRAVLINPNLALGWWAGGWVKVRLGEPDRAIEHFAHAMRLNPLDPDVFGMQQGVAHAHFSAGHHDEALACAKMALKKVPDSPVALRIAAASCALAGRGEEAKRLVARLLEV